MRRKNMTFVKDNYFFIVYSMDEYELPIGTFNNLQELADYMGRSKNVISNAVSKLKSGKLKTITCFNTGRKCYVRKWEEINGEVREI